MQRNIIFLIILNLIILAELVFALYKASQNPENVFVVFLQYFILLIVPTFVIGTIILRRLAKKEAQQRAQVFSKITTPELEQQRLLYSQLTEKEKSLTETQILQKPMAIKEILKKRAFVGKLLTACILVIFASFLDGCINRLLHPANLVYLLPGQSVKVKAPLEKRISSIHELSYTSTSDKIKLRFDSLYFGFWLGGPEWRGVLTVSPDIKPGGYKVIINIKGFEAKRPFAFIVRVFEDMKSLQRASMSLTTRAIGTSPWIVFGVSVFLFASGIFYILRLSNKIESIMLKNGQAEVFLVRKGEFVTRITFGLGNKNNIKPGDILDIYTDKGHSVGKVIVQQTTDKNSMGIVKSEYDVKPGFIVSVRKN